MTLMPLSKKIHDPFDLTANFTAHVDGAYTDPTKLSGLSSEFITWFEGVKTKYAFRQAKKALARSVTAAGRDADMMLRQLFEGCWAAQKYDQKYPAPDDPSKQQRELLKKHLEIRNRWAENLNAILHDWRENDCHTNAFHYAKEIAKKRKVLGPDEPNLYPKQWWIDLLQSLLDCLEGKHLQMLPPLFQLFEDGCKGAVFSHNTDVGCLSLPEGNVPPNAPTIQKQLAFKLIFHLREFTLPTDQRPACGARRWMPKGGVQNRKAAARLVEMTFPSTKAKLSFSAKKHPKQIERSVDNLVKKGWTLITFPD